LANRFTSMSHCRTSRQNQQMGSLSRFGKGRDITGFLRKRDR
jgi:hypothetical protein